MIKPDQITIDDTALVRAATGGDEAAFGDLTRRYRRELHVHCYRMVGSFEDAEDLVQETLLRAWQKRSSFEGRAPFRAWLYRIATNACLDFLGKHRRQLAESEVQSTEQGVQLPPFVPWLQPYPDRLLDQAGATDGPDSKLIARETIELAYMVALQYLAPKQRAALILCDVLDWSASETAALLSSSVASVNGLLRRARATLRERNPSGGSPPSNSQERALLERIVAATEACDVDALASLLRDDVRFSMPPTRGEWAGRDQVVRSWVEGGFGQPPFDDFRCVVVHANRMPGVVSYLRRPGENDYSPFAIDALRIEDGRVAEIITFEIADLLQAFALPARLTTGTSAGGPRDGV